MTKQIGNISIDTSISIAAYFPDSIRHILFNANRDLYESIFIGYTDYEKKRNSLVFSPEIFGAFLIAEHYHVVCCEDDSLNAGFNPDSCKTDLALRARRESANMIAQIEYRRVNKSNEFLISSRMVSSGKNYILNWQIFSPDIKTKSDIRNLQDSINYMHDQTDYDVIKL